MIPEADRLTWIRFMWTAVSFEFIWASVPPCMMIEMRRNACRKVAVELFGPRLDPFWLNAL